MFGATSHVAIRRFRLVAVMDLDLGRGDRVIIHHDNGLRETATVIGIRRIAGGAYVRLRMSDGTDYIAPTTHIERPDE